MVVTDMEQQEILTKFRIMISDCILPSNDDCYLLQWLKARDFDLTKAERMLRKSLKWRETQEIDLLTDDWQGPEIFRKFYPVGFSGYDKERHPVWIFPMGKTDLPGLLHHAGKEDYARYTTWIFERSLRLMRKQSVSQQIIICDLEGYTFRGFVFPAAMELYKELVRIYEANYPETLKKCVIINAPKAAVIAYNMFKTFMPVKTIEKITFFDSSRQNWEPVLLDMIDPDQLPVQWGGTRTDPIDGNPYCSSQICMGGEIPKEYFEQANA